MRESGETWNLHREKKRNTNPLPVGGLSDKGAADITGAKIFVCCIWVWLKLGLHKNMLFAYH